MLISYSSFTVFLWETPKRVFERWSMKAAERFKFSTDPFISFILSKIEEKSHYFVQISHIWGYPIT